MKYGIFFLLFFLGFPLKKEASGQAIDYPKAKISNEYLTMKLYLPDGENGYYRATRFDWSGIIYSLEYNGHNFFGEWKSTHDPFVHEDITGPAEAFLYEGLGYEEAKQGEGFMRIGVGILEKQDDTIYKWNHTYKILDYGDWYVNIGADWIEFKHSLASEAGWAYNYIKRIELLNEKPGFVIRHSLENTGEKIIETGQFNHNFFVIDNDTTGPDFQVEFPFTITAADGLKDRGQVLKVNKNFLNFDKKLTRGNVWADLKGFSSEVEDHQVIITNIKRRAGVRIKVDKPLYKMIFWAASTTLCPENYIRIDVKPGEIENWTSEYTFFVL
jgi:hypothetical protein